MKGIIFDQLETCYSLLGEVFINNIYLREGFNWLVTDVECYPQSEYYQKCFSDSYCWFSSTEMIRLMTLENPQWIWGVFSGFNKDVLLADVLKWKLPYANGYNGFWEPSLSIQHPLAEIEIVAWDNQCFLFISEQEKLIDMINNKYPFAKNLKDYNSNERPKKI